MLLRCAAACQLYETSQLINVQISWESLIMFLAIMQLLWAAFVTIQ